VTTATAEAVVPAEVVEAILRPRTGLVAEREEAPGLFVQEEGAAASYRREVTTRALLDGEVRVRQVVTFDLDLPFFSWLFILPVRRAVGGLRPDPDMPWWAPPQRLDRRAAVVLATLAGLAVVAGYLGALLSLTMTYAAREFGVGRTGQGVAFAVVRINIVLAFGILVVADRRGRRNLVLLSAAVGALVSALGAAAPSLAWLTVSQVGAVSLVAGLLILMSVMTAEEMPAGSRAWAIGVLGMATGLGAGLATMALPLADTGRRGWRWPYAFAVVALVIVAFAARRLEESRRFAAAPRGPGRATHGTRGRRRLVLIATGAFLFALFSTPAGQFHNEFLRTERAFSAARISALSLVSGTIGGLGVLVGGRMADRRGRRLVAGVGVALGALTTIGSYAGRGWSLWAWGIVDSFLGYAVGPALAVYGPELFPTSLRSRASGIVAGAYALGGVAGLVAAGVLSSAFGTLTPAFGVLAVGPLALVILIAVAYPETAGIELEDLNPEDRGSSEVVPPPPSGE